MTKSPEVTVLMPLYNGCRYVRYAIVSIIGQSYSNFEFIIIDDGSRDESVQIVRSFTDNRIVLLQNQTNMGVAATLNQGLDRARGRYIARMDADDISLPDRLALQVRFMENNSQLGISGTGIYCFGIGLPNKQHKPNSPEEISAFSLFENPLSHMSAIMRREMLDQHALRYNPLFSRCEDYELWSRAKKYFPLANIDNVLVRVRQHRASATLGNWSVMTEQTQEIQLRLLQELGINPTAEELGLHHEVGRGYRQRAISRLEEGEQWLLRLQRHNTTSQFFNRQIFDGIVGRIWFRYCANSAPLGLGVWKLWRLSPLAKMFFPNRRDTIRFAASIAWHKCRGGMLPYFVSAGEEQVRKEAS
ncbi:MAG: hypothetical protein BWK76_19220 [Desulfobulbaceae bacterium A2]|nr:MAG: hypothetical protein BWK76_19220 [Desulfobulbaceae bacterium A2]